MNMEPHVWEAWIGQKIARMESDSESTVIVLEDGRGIKFWTKEILYFTLTGDTDGPLWPEDAKPKLYPANVNGKHVLVSIPED